MQQLTDSVAAQVMGELNILTLRIDRLSGEIQQKIEAFPGAADKEMKRAGEAAITALSGQVARIAQTVAGDAAAVEKHAAFTKASLIAFLCVLGAGLLFGGAGFLTAKGIDSIRLNSAQKEIDEAHKTAVEAKSMLASYQAISDRNFAAEIEKIRAASGWAGTPKGRLAKQFFDLGAGEVAATCQAETWDIEKRKEGNWCVPQRRGLIGGDSQKYGWKIP